MGVFREEIQGLAALGINREEEKEREGERRREKEREGERRIQLMNTSYTYMFDLLHSLLVPRPRLKVGNFRAGQKASRTKRPAPPKAGPSSLFSRIILYSSYAL